MEALISTISEKFNKLKAACLADLPSDFSRDILNHLPTINQSELFKLIHSIPKGSIHHFHFGCHICPAFVISRINKYKDSTENTIYYNKEKHTLVLDNYNSHREQLLGKHFIPLNTLNIPDEELQSFVKANLGIKWNVIKYLSSQEMWSEFESKLIEGVSFIEQFEDRKDYLREIIKECYDLKVHNLQIRYSFGMVKDSQGNPIDPMEEFSAYKEIIEKFNERDYFSIQFIPSVGRSAKPSVLSDLLQKIKEVKEKLGDFILGFDMVGLEKSESLVELGEVFEGENEINFFFHAGEEYDGTLGNINKAIELGSKRIGHGLTAILSNDTIETLKEKGICIECCPISNFFLGFERDLSEHPARRLFEQNVPISISSDDDGVFGTNLITDDLVLVVLSWDLEYKDLLKLLRNTIEFCCLTKEKKMLEEVFEKELEMFEKEWS